MNGNNKFFITKQNLDYYKLNKKIDTYYRERGVKPYLFMNSATIETMDDDYNHSELCVIKTGCFCLTYHDSKVFCDETLKFGEIELR